MKDYYSQPELAEILGKSRSSICRRARTEEWRFIRRNVSGGESFYYNVLDFPPDINEAIKYHELATSPVLVPKQPVKPGQVRPLPKPEPDTDDPDQKRALARLEILKAFNSFHKSSSLNTTEAEKVFCELYVKQELNISSWVLDLENKLSVSKLRRLKGQYKKQGRAGLATAYGKQRRQSAVKPEMQIRIAGMLAERPGMRPINIFRTLVKTYPETCPNKATIYRYVKSWRERHHELVSLQENPSRWKNSYQAAHGDMAADVPHFGHTWEMDSTPADVITSDGKRASIVGSIDVYSRRVVAVVSPTSRSAAVAQCIRKGLLAWGIPARIRKDNGKDYASQHIESVTRSLEIETPKLPPYHGEAKPFIERFFWTLSRQLFEILPGYCGHSVAERQAIRDRKTWGGKIMEKGGTVSLPLTARELQEAIDKWIGQVYEAQEHKGIKDTPLNRAKQSPVWPTKIRDERTLDILLAPVAERIVQKKGIALDGGWYIADELIGHVRDKVVIRRDEADAGKVYVFLAKSGEFLCVASDEALSGERLSSYLAARRRHAKQLRAQVRAFETISQTLPDPYTIQVETGEIVEPPAKVARFQAEARTLGISEAKKAFAEPEPELGLADELGAGPIPVVDIQEKRAEKEAREEADKWATYPDELLDSPNLLYDWFQDKERAVGLSADEADHMEYLLREFPSIKNYLSARERMKDEALRARSASEQHHSERSIVL